MAVLKLISVFGVLLTYGVYAQYTFYPEPGHHTIVQMSGWRWDDIGAECGRYLGPNKFAAIQVPPAAEHLVCREFNRPWWEVYQPVSYLIGTRGGSETTFDWMVDRCNRVGVRTIVEVVLNHMTSDWPNTQGTLGSTAEPEIRFYPAVPFLMENFNNPPCSINDYNNSAEVRTCELFGLHDLSMSNSIVRQKHIDLLNSFIALGVAGFWIDASKHMEPSYLQGVFDSLDDLSTEWFPPGSRPYIVHDVLDSGFEAVKKSEYYGSGQVAEHQYGPELGRGFRGEKPLASFQDFGENWGLAPHQYAVVFNDNTDTQRGHGIGGAESVITFNEPRLLRQAIAYMHAWPHGTPRIMSSYVFSSTDEGPPMETDESIKDVIINPDGTCGNGWVCEHRWNAIRNMVEFRNTVEGEIMTDWWDNGNNQIAFCRGDKGFIAINADTGDLSQNLMTCLPAGTYCDVISGGLQDGSCTGLSVVVAANGTADISILGNATDGVVVIHVNARLS